MRKSLNLCLFVLALAIAYASSEAYGQSQSNAAATQNPQAASPSSQSTPSGAQGQTTKPAGGSGSVTSVPGGATDASGGGIAGSAGAPAGKTEVPETPQPGAAPVSDTELQSQIQNALSKEPTLAGDTVNARVSSDSIDLTGTVGTAREKLTATRIVESYAGNKKVVSHLTIGNRNGNASPTANRPDREANPPGSRTGASTRPPM
jgi:BON domain